MEINLRILIVSLICLDIAGEAVGVLCSFRTSHGMLQRKHCHEACCEGPDIRYATVCCYHKHESTIYIGTSMAALVGFVVLILCATYVCCKRKILQRSRAFESRHRNTRIRRTSPMRENSVPTVSSQVQPPVPPPYENLPPPPYYPVEQGTSQKKENKSTFPDEAPPAYSQFDSYAV